MNYPDYENPFNVPLVAFNLDDQGQEGDTLIFPKDVLLDWYEAVKAKVFEKGAQVVFHMTTTRPEAVLKLVRESLGEEVGSIAMVETDDGLRKPAVVIYAVDLLKETLQ